MVVKKIEKIKKKSIAELWRDVLQKLPTRGNLLLRAKVYKTRQLRRYFAFDPRAQEIYFTQREMETIELLAKGLTLKHIARQMGLSHRTIEFYVKNIRKKLNCPSKKKLVEFIEARR